MQFNITFKTIFEYVLKKLVLCIQIRFVSTEKTTRIASRASCFIYFYHPLVTKSTQVFKAKLQFSITYTLTTLIFLQMEF